MKKHIRIIAIIQLLLIGLLFAMLFSCAPQKQQATHTEFFVECQRDTMRIYIPVKRDKKLLKKLQKENHLLRVEITHLKSEQKKIQELIEINETAKKLKKNLSNLKEEICE